MKRATREWDISPTPHGISIHALVKRATFSVTIAIIRIPNFNPRPREKGDFSIKLDTPLIERFQSTPS